VGRAPAAPGVAASTVANASYRPGAVAIVHAAPAKASQLAEVPADSVGGFVYIGGTLALHDLSSRGVRYTGLAGVELQGWVKVKKKGRLQLGEDLRATLGPATVVGPECLFQAWLEDRLIGAERAPLSPGSGREARASLVLGADLQPGLYKLRLWSACLPSATPASPPKSSSRPRPTSTCAASQATISCTSRGSGNALGRAHVFARERRGPGRRPFGG
jgi:hypothetical protein